MPAALSSRGVQVLKDARTRLQVSGEALAALQKALPQCAIIGAPAGK